MSLVCSAFVARRIENTLLQIETVETPALHYVANFLLKIYAVFIFRMALLIDLIVEIAICIRDGILWCALGCIYDQNGDWQGKQERIEKCALGILCAPLAWIEADGVSCLYLQREQDVRQVIPFGVEHVYGKMLQEPIHFPNSIQEVQEIVWQAKQEGKQISIRGAGMSQGEQTVPAQESGIVLDLRKINQAEWVAENVVKVGAGATWEQLQLFVNQSKKSILVKQASDVFSIGGSIAVNCHGWEHNLGSIASTVEELEVIDATGALRTLSLTSPHEEERELFRSFFGTLGFFGVIVSAKLKVTDNIELQEKGVKVNIEEFDAYYKQNIKGRQDKPLLMGRLNVDEPFLTQLIVNTFEVVDDTPRVTPGFALEPKMGERIARIFLDCVARLPRWLEKPLMQFYWDREIKIMQEEKKDSRNNIMHFGIKSFFQLHQSNLHSQWLQEYFIAEENLPEFIAYLGDTLHRNEVRLLNASIRPVPQDEISILPYAEKDRYAVVISFAQLKVPKAMEKTKQWIQEVQNYLLSKGDKWYQAYMPYASAKEFAACYGQESLSKLQELKQKYDPDGRFGSGHTAKYYQDNTQ